MILLIHSGAALAQQVFRGQAAVSGPGLLVVENTRILLFGADAPGRGQTCRDASGVWNCATESEQALRNLVGIGETQCTQRAFDSFRRVLAQCVAGGKDIGEEMVRSGFAVAVKSETDAYVPAERQAEAARVGLWRGQFLRPWEFRQSVTNTPDSRK